jgi:hypothetical protein
MPQHFSVSEVARRNGVPPRVISDLFYQRLLSDERCPVIGGRRLIPADYLPAITAVLLGRGRRKATTGKQQGST